MKVQELMNYFNACIRNDPDFVNNKVVIILNERSIGPTACTDIKSMEQGFDWDLNRVLLFPTARLTRRSKDEK